MNAIDCILESNRIEGIYRNPTNGEISEFERFINLEKVTVEQLERFVKVYQPNARLRDKKGLNVIIGNHTPPSGGIRIKVSLEELLCLAELGYGDSEQAYLVHKEYETLHPFTDGNGRSGRMLWYWMLRRKSEDHGHFPLNLGFLHTWYYQTLQYGK